MNIAPILSVIGNNSKLAPIVVKDYVENTSKVTLAYKQGEKKSPKTGKYEARECFVEEFGTSAIWLASVPVIKKVVDKLVLANVLNLKNVKLFDFKNQNITEIDQRLLSGKYYQKAEENLKSVKDSVLKTDMKNIIDNSKLFTNVKKSTLWLGVAATIALLYNLTLFKQKITEKSLEKHNKKVQKKPVDKEVASSNPAFKASTFKEFINKTKSHNAPTFTGLDSAFMIDLGTGAGRIMTGRTDGEKKEYLFKTLSFLACCYGSGPVIEKAFNAISKALKLPIHLDAKILGDKNFAQELEKAAKSKEAQKEFLAFAQNITDSDEDIVKEKKIIDFIDDNIKNHAEYDEKGMFKSFKNKTLEFARISKLIDIKDNAKHSSKFIDVNAVEEINNNLKHLLELTAEKIDIKHFANKVKLAKYGAIVANLGIGVFLTAYVLPKTQYLFREKVIGQSSSPGLNNYNIPFKGQKC